MAVTLKFRSQGPSGSSEQFRPAGSPIFFSMTPSKCVGPTAVLGALDRVVDVASESWLEASDCDDPPDPHPTTAKKSAINANRYGLDVMGQ
jgi:hypothetical protein